MSDPVEVVGPEPSGLAEMLGAVARTALERQPARARHLHGPPGVVRIVATDAGVAVCLEFRDGRLRVYSGDLSAPPDATIEADSSTLAGFAAVPRLGPLPNPFKKPGRAVLRKALRGEIKIRGAVKSRKLLDRMRGVLTTDP